MKPNLATVLYLSESFPFDLAGGYKLRIAATILTLTHRYQVHLLSYHPQPLSKAQAVAQVKAFAETLPPAQKNQFLSRLTWSLVVLPDVNQPITQRWREWLHSWRTQEPFLVWQYHNHSQVFQQQLNQLVTQLQPAIIHFSHLRLAANLKPWLNSPTSQPSQPKLTPKLVYEAQNVEWLLAQSFVDFLPKLGRWHWWWHREQWLTKKFEQWVVTHVDQTLTLSRDDTAALKALGAQNVTTWPIAYPPNGQTTPPPPLPTKNPPLKLLFLGNLEWLPNADALRWFLTKIWPGVAVAHSTVELIVVGQPCSYFQLKPRVASNRVHFMGFVADTEPFLSQCQIAILPFRMGGGIRLKALTTAWAGQAIVSTPLGVQGLDLKHERDCLIAKDAPAFIHQLTSLLNQPEKISRLGAAAQRYVVKHHGLSGTGSSIHSKT